MTDFLLLATILLCAGVIAVPIASRLGLGSVLGFLLAGIAIGPILALLHVDVVSLQHFAEFGVVMMLFLVGLELEPKLLWQMRARLLGLGGGQVVATALLVAVIAMLLDQTWQIALTVGLILGLSSTAIVLQTLNEKGLMKSDGGQASFSVLLMQDIAVIPMLALLPLLASSELAALVQHSGAGEEHGSEMSLVAGLNGWQTMLATLGAVGAIVLVGSFLTRPIFRFVAAAGLRELFTAAALMIVIGIALLMTLVGLSPALGTFIAGVVLANSEYKHELESDIDPFRGLLLGLFFITVGAGVDFALFSSSWMTILSWTLGLILVKAVVLFLLGTLFGIRGAQRWLLTLGLAQAGEFGFVLLSFTVANGILPDPLADQLLVVVALSMLLTPALFIVYDRFIAPRYAKGQEREPDAFDEARPILIAGRGRVGGIVGRMLEAAGYATTVIDYNSRHLDALRKFGAHAYFGDATRPDLLEAAGIRNARILVVAIDDKDRITQLVSYALRTYPNLHVIARAVDRDHVYVLWSLGCRDIIRETYDSSLRMGRSAFEALGASREAAEKIKDEFAAMDRRSMIEVADVYDITIPPSENAAYVAKVRAIANEWEPELRRRICAIMDDVRAKESGVEDASRAPVG